MSELKFEKTFGDGGGYVCEGDRIEVEVDGITYTARIERDADTGIDDDDCHGPQSVTGADDEQQAKIDAARAAWESDEWFYCGVIISASKAGIELDDHAASLWAIECNYPTGNNAYLTEVANELLSEAQETAREAIYRLTRV